MSLPAGVTPKVVTGSTDSLPVAQLAVSSNLDVDQVAAVLRDEVRPLLTGLDGVADVTLSGIRDPQITIDVDTVAAAAHGVSLTGVMTLLQANGVRLPAGQPAPDTNPLTVEVGSPITSVDVLQDLYLPPTFGATGSIAGAPATGGLIHPSAMLVPLQPPGTVTVMSSVATAAPNGGAQPGPTVPPSPSPSVSPRPSATPTPTRSAAPRPTTTPTDRAHPVPKAAPRAGVPPGGPVKPPAVVAPPTGPASPTPVRLGCCPWR